MDEKNFHNFSPIFPEDQSYSFLDIPVSSDWNKDNSSEFALKTEQLFQNNYNPLVSDDPLSIDTGFPDMGNVILPSLEDTHGGLAAEQPVKETVPAERSSSLPQVSPGLSTTPPALSFIEDPLTSTASHQQQHHQPTSTINHQEYSNSNSSTFDNNVKDEDSSINTHRDEAEHRDESREWDTVYADNSVLGENYQINIQCKTRLEDATSYIPSRLYSSLKYELHHEARGKFTNEHRFLMARARVIDAETHEEILKDGKPVLKGDIETALNSQPSSSDSAFTGKLRLQFTVVSYHLERKSFMWEIRYFAPENLDNPCMIKRSAAFKVYARKPKNNNNNKGGRKRAAPSTAATASTNMPAAKKYRTSVSSNSNSNSNSSTTTTTYNSTSSSSEGASSFSEFINKLEELENCNSRLPENERKCAIELVVNKFVKLQSSDQDLIGCGGDDILPSGFHFAGSPAGKTSTSGNTPPHST
eukprot:gb/GECH01005672.1/.p1 GENE.gb/GECH01005672.1/~~gb/GECH01005672.1/.p1  ORF type:complete len:473 (+),score=126.19 gb/GECH01005672.1/:1-1419(+)